jgi:hypothetical protein
MHEIFKLTRLIQARNSVLMRHKGNTHPRVLTCLASEQIFSRPQENIKSDQICVDVHPNVFLLRRTITHLVKYKESITMELRPHTRVALS